MFNDEVKTAEDVREIIRSEWKWNEVCVEHGMDINRAVDEAFAYGQGVTSVLKSGMFEKVFTDEFREEWENWRNKMLFGE